MPEPVLRRHADHDPALICRPALGYGLCEVLEAEAVEAMRNDAGAWGEPVKPRKSERRQRNAMVSVRFTPEELATVQERAGDMPLSAYLRLLALAIEDAGQLRAWRGTAVPPDGRETP